MNKIDKFIRRTMKEHENSLVPLSERKISNNKPLVSIHCLVFNQEPFIRRCLDSFLMQLVNFDVEIIIHDDCSTDGSQKIIEEYHNAYPQIIKIIFEKENIYSKTGNFLEIEEMVNELSCGKYIAICEADDYWTDPYKLFIQVMCFDRFDCSFCVHKVFVSKVLDGIMSDNVIPSFKRRSRIIDSVKFISIVNYKYSFQTSSYFFKKEDYDKMYTNRPKFTMIMPTDDECLIHFFGSLGDTLYIDRPMSCYVQFTSGSWSANNKSLNDKSDKIAKYVDAIKEFNSYTNFKYSKSCNKSLERITLFQLLHAKDYDSIFSNKLYKKLLKEQDLKFYYSIKIRRFFKRA